MAPSSDDRDRNFETALARHFRASVQPETGPASLSCADIEALAAYHEGGLSPEQRILWKTHIEGCAHCQGILAQLAATDAIPIDVADKSEKQKTAGLPTVLKPRRPTLWRWAAPAGAIAAVLLVWITVRENKPLQVQEVSSRKEASSAQQTASLKPPEPESKTPTANEQQLVAPKPSAIAGAAAAVQQKRDSNRAAGGSAVPSMPTPTTRERTAENSANLYATAPPHLGVGGRTDAAAKNLKEKAPAFLPPAAAPAAAPPDASEVSALSETVEVEAAPAAPLKSATVNPSDRGALQKQELPMLGRSNQALVLLTKGVGGVIVAAPQGTAEWRIGAAGLVEHSSDAGATWTLQSTGVVADLLAGSATSDKVCWIVGRAGTILRTTDGGAHWSKLPPPIVDDFASVFAVNARQATVSPTSGTYQTKDGGATWKKLAPE
jgi:hypothetical protein